jgi:hypothetical protein
MRKQIILALLVGLLFGLLPIVAGATNVIDSGSCGEGVTYELTDAGILTVSGEGRIASQTNAWHSDGMRIRASFRNCGR